MRLIRSDKLLSYDTFVYNDEISFIKELPLNYIEKKLLFSMYAEKNTHKSYFINIDYTYGIFKYFENIACIRNDSSYFKLRTKTKKEGYGSVVSYLMNRLKEYNLIDYKGNDVTINNKVSRNNDEKFLINILGYSGMYFDIIHNNKVKECVICLRPTNYKSNRKKYCDLCSETINKTKR